jgi:hypothetical protein
MRSCGAEGRCLTAGRNRSLNKMPQPLTELAKFLSGRCQEMEGCWIRQESG